MWYYCLLQFDIVKILPIILTMSNLQTNDIKSNILLINVLRKQSQHHVKNVDNDKILILVHQQNFNIKRVEKLC
ncbi:MAG: hypothetical protein EAZ87_02360 [Nostocales cyanobacterium]|nr:MAG: hypothetical protein EAZ87_02360 [Nostocales cyanobacterium]